MPYVFSVLFGLLVFACSAYWVLIGFKIREIFFAGFGLMKILQRAVFYSATLSKAIGFHLSYSFLAQKLAVKCRIGLLF